MCAQCVSAGAAYVVPALAGLQLYKVRRRKRTAKPVTPVRS